jgi:hypothetical protein
MTKATSISLARSAVYPRSNRPRVARARRLHTRFKAVMDAVKAQEDIPDYLIPAICKDPVFQMVCEACQHVSGHEHKPKARRSNYCEDCGEAMCPHCDVCHDCED